MAQAADKPDGEFLLLLMREKEPSSICANRFLLSVNTRATAWRAQLSQRQCRCPVPVWRSGSKPQIFSDQWIKLSRLVLVQAPRLPPQPVQVLPLGRRGWPTPILPIAFVQTRPALCWPSTSSRPSRPPWRTAAPSCRQPSRHLRTLGGHLFVAPATKSSGEAARAHLQLDRFRIWLFRLWNSLNFIYTLYWLQKRRRRWWSWKCSPLLITLKVGQWL